MKEVILAALFVTVLVSLADANVPTCREEISRQTDKILTHIVNTCERGEFLTIKAKEGGKDVIYRITCKVRIVKPGDGLTHPGQRGGKI